MLAQEMFCFEVDWFCYGLDKLSYPRPSKKTRSNQCTVSEELPLTLNQVLKSTRRLVIPVSSDTHGSDNDVEDEDLDLN